MPESNHPVEEIQVGESVAYRLSTGDRVGRVRGKMLGLFKTHDGQTLADVDMEHARPAEATQD